MKISVVLGTRPEIIKMAPVIRELEQKKADFFVLHTGQHYSYTLDRVFFEQLKLADARYNLEVGSGSHAEQTAKILVGIERALQDECPDVVLVEGDTNSVLAGAIAASKLHIKVGHVEAGLRSYDRNMPEEINRILTDHCADYLFAPTEMTKAILLGEGIPESQIFVTGNTIVDAVFQNLQIAKNHNNTLAAMELTSKEYFLSTLHRQENVDDAPRLGSILKGLDEVTVKFGMPVILPAHPHTVKRLEEFDISPQKVKIVDPVDYLGFLQLESDARLILTDSGGVQEESCILGVPCVTLRDNTERPETIDVGANVLAGSTPETILECAHKMLSVETNWSNPFGDGHTGKRIISILEENVS